MKIFISWSGERSRLVAEALRYWLPKVIQAVQPWMSASDIEKGTRWRTDIANELEQTSIGIICLTPENLGSTWLHFEAGALSKQQQNTYVCTLLYELEPADVREPLAQFQTTKAQKDDIRSLVDTINNAFGDVKLPDSEIRESFEVWWPRLEAKLNSIPVLEGNPEPQRPDREILEEILELFRVQTRIEQTFLNDTRLVKFRMPNAVNLSVQDFELLSDYYQSLQIYRQSYSKQIERLRTDDQYALECLRTLQDKERYFDKDWPSAPLIRKHPDALNSVQNSPFFEKEDKPHENSDS